MSVSEKAPQSVVMSSVRPVSPLSKFIRGNRRPISALVFFVVLIACFTAANPRLFTNPLIYNAVFVSLPISIILVVPLVSGDRVIGTLSLDETRGPRVWSEGDQGLAMTMGAQIALAVDRARQYEESAQRAAEVQTLSAIGETLASTLDVQEVLDAIADSATKLTGAQRAVVFEMDQQAGHLLARAMRGMDVEKGYLVRVGQGAVGECVARRAPVMSADVVASPPPGYDSLQEHQQVTLAEMARRFGYRAVLAVPVVSREVALGAVGIGQSSWGPTGFAFAGSEADASAMVAAVHGVAARDIEVRTVRGRNFGARIFPAPLDMVDS